MTIRNTISNVGIQMGPTAVITHYKSFINYFNYQANKYKDNIYLKYYSNGSLKSLTYSQVNIITTNLACKLAKDVAGSRVISFIGDHNIDYIIIMIALLKLKLVLFNISPRNSEAAVTNLLQKTDSTCLVTTPKYQSIAKNATSNLNDIKLITIQPMDYEKLSQEDINPRCIVILDYNFSDEDINKPAMIIHSSGSTSFPKPIYLSNRYLIHSIKICEICINQQSEIDNITHKDVFLSLPPLFHVMGIYVSFTAIHYGSSVVFLESIPAPVDTIMSAIRLNNITILVTSTIIYEQLIPYLDCKQNVNSMQHLKLAIFGGAPMKQEVGEWYHKRNINLRAVYGMTEAGHVLTSDFNPKSNIWNSVKPYDHPEYYVFEPEDSVNSDIFHLTIRPGCPSVANNAINRPDGGYDTNDLFKKDPNNPGYYIYFGRRDDTLIMDNGEKTNPVPMELTIRTNPIIKQVAILGHGRQCTSALIEVDQDHAMEYSPDEIIDRVHNAVKMANIECPNHSTIFPEMIKILPLKRKLPLTDKGSVMRKKTAIEYQEVLDKLYDNFLKNRPPKAVGKPMDASTWTIKQTQEFLITCVSQVLKLPKSAFENLDQSFFDIGMNSINSIQVRNSISEYFKVSQNIIFQYPTIRSLSDALMNNRQSVEDQIQQRYQQTQNLATKYIEMAKQDFNMATNNYKNRYQDQVVLLTGATGSLGSFILRDLLRNQSVKKIYCLIRGRPALLFNRLVRAFKTRCLDTSLLNTDRLEVLPMRLDDEFLGFDVKKYNQLKKEVTIVQHCAWMLDFNMTIDYYDKECIAPFYNLLKFAYCQENPMHVHFISSVSASAKINHEVSEVPLPLDANVAMPMGYAQSKFVIEMLLNYLTSSKNFPCYVHRVGQVIGDTVNGVWNTTEQYPLMFIGGGSLLHRMPDLQSTIDWIPVDYASTAIVDIMLRTSDLPSNINDSIYHIVNPNTIKWSDVIDVMRSLGMKFKLTSMKDWITNVSKDTENPCQRLLSFYQLADSLKLPNRRTDKTASITPLLYKAPVLDERLFEKYLKYWQKCGFYDPSV